MKTLRSRLALIGSSTLLCVGLSIAFAPAASAGNCGNGTSGHCYAFLRSGSDAGAAARYTNGEGVDLSVSCQKVASGFETFETWQTMNTNPAQYWIESGIFTGSLIPGHAGSNWFWSDSRPNGYTNHYVKAATLGSTYTNVTIGWVRGTTNWNVSIGGSIIGTSTGNSANSGGRSLGAEVGGSTSTSPVVVAAARNWQQNNGSAWGAVPVDSAGYGNNNAGLSLTHGTLNGLPTLGVAAKNCSSSPTSISSRGQAASMASLDVTALKATAAVLGEKAPTNLVAVNAVRGTALTRSDDGGVSSNAPVTVIEARGKFTSPTESPTGSKVTGTVLRVYVDASGAVTDYSISRQSGHLSTLGAVRTIK